MKLKTLLATLFAMLFVSMGANAQTQSWTNGSTDGFWNTTSLNWSDDGLGDLNWQSADAIFGTTGVGTVNISTGATGVSANSLTFNTAGYTITSSTTDTLTLTGAASITANADATIAAPIAGTAGLNTSGAGTLTLSSVSAYSGATNITGGVLNLTGQIYNTGGGSAVVTVSSGATLNIYGLGTSGHVDSLGSLGTGAANLVLNGGTLEYSGTAQSYATRNFTVGVNGATLEASQTAGTWYVPNGVTNNSSLTLSGASATGDYQGVISGTGSLIKNGDGLWQLEGTNTFTGPVTINAGTLGVLTTNATLGSGSSAVTLANVSSALLSINAGNYGISTVSIGSLSGGGATGGNVDTEGDTLIVGTDNTSTTFAGSIENIHHWGGAGVFTKVGTGTLTLSGSNTFNGVTNINGGVLALGSANAITNGNITFGGGTLQYSASNQSDQSARIVNSTSAISIDLNGQTVNYYSGIASSNTGGFTLMGSGTLALNAAAANNYSGATNINGGTLVLLQPAATLGSGSTALTLANVAGAGIIFNPSNWGKTTITISSLSGGGTTGGNINLDGDTLNVGNDNSSTTYGGVISSTNWGNGNLVKAGTGTLVLTNASTYSGSTTITGGALQLGDGTSGHDGSLATANILNNGTLIYDNYGAVSVNGIISGSGGLTTIGSGTLTLNGANTYSGATAINGGQVLLAGGVSTLGSGSSALTIANNATALLSIDTQNDGAITYSIGSLSGGGALGGNIVINGGATLSVGSDNTSTTYSGIISQGSWANGNLAKVGTGTLTLDGTFDAWGNVTVNGGVLEVASTGELYPVFGIATINTGGTLKLNGAWGLGTGGFDGNFNTNATSLVINGGTIDMAANYTDQGRAFTIGANGATLAVESGVTWALNSDLSWQHYAGGLITITNTTSLTFDGAGTGQFNMALAGSGNLIKNGAGSWSLGVANSYTGTTTINTGTLKLAAAGSISASTLVDIKAGATFDTTAQSFTMLSAQPFSFTIDGTAGLAGKISAAALDITNGVVTITATGLLMQPAYVLATYSPGGLTGTQFNSVTLPTGGWYLDYNYQNLNEIALVIPEPQTWMMLLGGVGMLTMFRRRRD